MQQISNALLFDFGASRIKAAFLCDGEIVKCTERASPPPCESSRKIFEVAPSAILNVFNRILSEFSEHDIQAIFVCSEMHGFILLDRNNRPLTNYISWKDERCLIPNDHGECSFSVLSKQIGDHFFQTTGMKSRPCYPLFNLHSLLQNSKFVYAKVCTLSDLLCSASGLSENVSHATMAAGLGFYNIYDRKIDEGLVELISFGTPLNFNAVSDDVIVGGYIKVNGKAIPMYTGVGDHQCAVLGAGNTSETISVNLGTGSQVAAISMNGCGCEQRPYFNGDLLSVITHIPSGRVLNSIQNFIVSINPNYNFWASLAKVDVKMMQESTLDFNLSLFESAWNFSSYGSILGIRENNFTLDNFIASLVESYKNQYIDAIRIVTQNKNYKKIIISGGIGTKMPHIANAIEQQLSIATNIYSSKFDETLHGLQIIVKNIS